MSGAYPLSLDYNDLTPEQIAQKKGYDKVVNTIIQYRKSFRPSAEKAIRITGLLRKVIPHAEYKIIENFSPKDLDEFQKQTGKSSPPKGLAGVSGKVSFVTDLGTGKILALKTISNTEVIERSKNNKELYKQLEGQPCLMPLFDFGDGKDEKNKPVLYQIMPYAEFGDGKVLQEKLHLLNDSELIISDPLLKTKIMVEGLNCILSAVDYLHKRGIYHLDLKPPNIFIDRYGRWYVGDIDCAAQSKEAKLSYKEIQVINITFHQNV